MTRCLFLLVGVLLLPGLPATAATSLLDEWTLAEWQALGDTGTNGIEADPLFADPANGQLFIGIGSPADGKGADLDPSLSQGVCAWASWVDSVTLCEQRVGRWDIGAFLNRWGGTKESTR